MYLFILGGVGKTCRDMRLVHFMELLSSMNVSQTENGREFVLIHLVLSLCNPLFFEAIVLFMCGLGFGNSLHLITFYF